jgi:hypothetical protein
MSNVLKWLTWALVGIVVLVLSVYLILIAAALIRTNRNLEALVAGLEAVHDNTLPLSDRLSAINRAAAALRDHLQAVNDDLRTAAQLVHA